MTYPTGHSTVRLPTRAVMNPLKVTRSRVGYGIVCLVEAQCRDAQRNR